MRTQDKALHKTVAKLHPLLYLTLSVNNTYSQRKPIIQAIKQKLVCSAVRPINHCPTEYLRHYLQSHHL